MKKLKKIIAMCMVTVMAMSVVCVGASASSRENNVCDKRVYSPQFPNAYIIQDVSEKIMRDGSNTENVSATVFVEEVYSLDENNEPITVSSRLLNENEVISIGIENFDDMAVSKEKALNDLARGASDTNARGKLSLSFSRTYSVSGSKVTCNLTGNASWSAGAGLFNGSTNPASGSDYLGVLWSGGFTGSGTINGTPSWPSNIPLLVPCNSIPNVGRVWEFEEAWSTSSMGQSVNVWMADLDVSMTLTKNTMTGNGNTAEAVLEYIHTYESTHGSISIEASTSGVGGGFTLSNVDDQWSLACTVTGIPY